MDWNRLKQMRPYLARVARYSHDWLNSLWGIYTILSLPDSVRYQPESVKLETTTRCNLACQFCGRTWAAAWAQGIQDLPMEVEARDSLLKTTRRAGSHMPMTVFQRLLAQFPALCKLDVQGMGEPLMNPDFISMLEFASRRKVTSQFFTNGTLLSNEMARKLIEQRLSEITVSLDGATSGTYEFIRYGADFSRVVANIAGLVEARRRARKKTPLIRLAAVVTRQNVQELPDLVRLGHQIGVDQVVVTQFKCISQALISWMCDQEAIAEMLAESRRVAAEVSMPFIIEFALPGKAARRPSVRSRARCLWPWFSINITLDGNVTPCSYIPRAEGWALGNTLETSFADIWNGHPYRTLRKAMRTGCMSETVCGECIDKV